MNETPKQRDDQNTVVEQAAEQAEPSGDASEAPAGEQSGEDRIEHLRAALDSAAARMQAAEERALRLQAEMDNLRKRTEREIENAHKYGVERLLTELLPVIDSMELGLNAAEEKSADVASTREGMELTARMLRSAMEKFGVEPLDPAGEPFDPDAHQAISMQPGNGTPANTVLTVVQKGYRLNGRLVRPAMVVVAR